MPDDPEQLKGSGSEPRQWSLVGALFAMTLIQAAMVTTTVPRL